MKTLSTYNEIYEKWLDIDEFTELEREIADTLKLEYDCTRGINAAKLRSKEPHPADIEFAATSREKAIELVKGYAEKAMRHDKSKLTTLATVVENRTAKIQQSSMHALIIGKLLMDFLKANDRLPTSRTELLNSAKAEYKAEIAEQKTPWSQLCTRGLNYYGLVEVIQDKRGRKN